MSQTLFRMASRWVRSWPGRLPQQTAAQPPLLSEPSPREPLRQEPWLQKIATQIGLAQRLSNEAGLVKLGQADSGQADSGQADLAQTGAGRDSGSWRGSIGRLRRTLATSPQRILRPLLLGTSFLLTLGVVLLEVSSAALFLEQLEVTALALVYAVTAVLGFGLRELDWLLSRALPSQISRSVRALAWAVLVAVWMGLCFNHSLDLPRLGLWLETAELPAMSFAAPRALGQVSDGLMSWQLLLLQCGAALLGQFHRAQVQRTTLATLSDQELAQDKLPPQSPSPTSFWQSLISLPLAWFTFGAYVLVGLALPWALGTAGASLPLVSVALASGLLVLFGAIPRLILLGPAVKGRGLAAEADSMVDRDFAVPLPLRRYSRLLLAFFGLGQWLTLLIQWGLWGQLQLSFVEASAAMSTGMGIGISAAMRAGMGAGIGVEAGAGAGPNYPMGALAIAAFLAGIQGIVGLAGLLLQGVIARGWLTRHGAFTALAWSPLIMLVLSLWTATGWLPLLWGLALLRGLDEGLQYGLRQYVQGRLLAHWPRSVAAVLQQRRTLVESLAMGLLGILFLLLQQGWHGLSPAQTLTSIGVLTLVTLLFLTLLRHRYFQLILGAIEQQVIGRRFPKAPLEQLGAAKLLSQQNNVLVKRGLIKTLRRSLREPVQLETAIVSVRLLDRLDPLRAVQILAPALVRLPPLLQLEGLAIMTRLDRQFWVGQSPRGQQSARQNARGNLHSHLQGGIRDHSLSSHSLSSHGLSRAFATRRYQPQAHLDSVTALMTPSAPTAVFAAALRYSLYLGPRPSPEALHLHLQPDCAPEVRAVAATFVLNPVLNPVLNSVLNPALDPESNPDLKSHLNSGQTPLSHAASELPEPWGELGTQAQSCLQAMLSHPMEEERLAASAALAELTDLAPFQTHIPDLLEDFSPQVRQAVIAAIVTTRSQFLYPHLLKALRSPLVAQPAHEALMQLGDEAVPLLRRCTQHPNLSLDTKLQSWRVLADIGSDAARSALAEDVLHQQGSCRQRLLSLLLTQPQGASALSLALAGADGVMQLVREELWLLNHLYAALVELHPKLISGFAAKQLRQALVCQQRDVGERVLLLLQIRYPEAGLGRIVQQLRQRQTIPQALKRLSQILEPPLREPLLALFDARPAQHKRSAFAAWDRAEAYGDRPSQSCTLAARLCQLIVLEPGLEPQALIWAYELALEQSIALDDAAVLRGTSHADLGVRSAAQAYLNCMPDTVVAALLS